MIHFHASKILIPVDFSDTSLLAIKHGVMVAKTSKAHIHLLHVVNTHFVSQDMFIPKVQIDKGEMEHKASEKLNQLAADLKAQGMDVQCSVCTGSPSREISEYAKEKHIDMIIMGTHGYSPMEELVIGSTALKVITKSPCPVMAMSSAASATSGYSKILLPIDNTVNSRQKVNYALEMAKKFNASVHVLVVLGSGEESEKGAMETVVHQIEELAKEKGVSLLAEIKTGVKNRANTTVEYGSKIGADLTIIMTDQDAELSGFFLGPYSQQVIHLSKTPVIAIKPKDLFIKDTSPIPGTGGYNF